MVSSFTQFFAILTVVAQALTVLGILSLIFRKKLSYIYNLFLKKGSLLSFIIALLATLGSLFFSEIAHYTPCVLCWYQRIFMYPQAMILGIAFFRKEKVAIYSLALSVIGVVLSGYHYALQVGAIHEIVPCSTGPTFAVSCANKPFMTFGYITIPMMAFSAFALIIVIQLIHITAKKQK